MERSGILGKGGLWEPEPASAGGTSAVPEGTQPLVAPLPSTALRLCWAELTLRLRRAILRNRRLLAIWRFHNSYLMPYLKTLISQDWLTHLLPPAAMCLAEGQKLRVASQAPHRVCE